MTGPLVTDSRTFIVRGASDVARVVDTIRRLEVGPGHRPAEVRIGPHEQPISDGQRRLLFALCGELAEQLECPGGGGRLDAEGWKDLLVGLCRGERIVREGQVIVIVGGSISGATRTEATDLITFVEAYGAQRGVTFGAR